MIKISPSLLAVDYEDRYDAVKSTRLADMLHIDVMDGKFVPQTTPFLNPEVTKKINKLTSLPLDVHLMIEEPEKYIIQFAKAGAGIITFHYEATDKPIELIELIHSKNKLAGIALNPNTSLDKKVIEIMNKADLLLLMSVVPGMCGQKYIDKVTKKIAKAREIISTKSYDLVIQVDGGIKLENAYKPINAGADILVSGSGIFKPGNDYDKIIRQMKDVILIGSDHGGIELKQKIKKYLNRVGHAYADVGTNSNASCDYPDFAEKVAKPISEGENSRGILICGSGQGMSMAANRYPNVRAAILYKANNKPRGFMGKITREHNDSNIAVFGERTMDNTNAIYELASWLNTQFSGDKRHIARINKFEGYKPR